MFCSYWTHLGPTSLLESLGAEIVRILDLVTHSNNFDFLDKIQNLSEYIFSCDEQLKKWLGHSVRSFFCNQVVISESVLPEVNTNKV